MRLRTRWVGLLSWLAVASVGASARAQEVDGSAQLALGTALLSYASTTETVEGPGGSTDFDTSAIGWGTSGQSAFLELGYGLTDVLVLGGLVSFGGVSAKASSVTPGQPDAESSRTSVSVGPKLDAMFAPDAVLRPLIGARAALVYAGLDASGATESLTGVQLAARGGLRGFLGRAVSLDPVVEVSWTTASGGVTAGDTTLDTSASIFGVGLLLGLSAWL